MLEAEARAALVDARGGERWLEEHPAIGPAGPTAVAERDVFVAVLAFAGRSPSVVVGYLVLDLDGAIARVDQVYVTPEARELGLRRRPAGGGDRGGPRRRGAIVLEGQALPGDRDTKNLYERAGHHRPPDHGVAAGC